MTQFSLSAAKAITTRESEGTQLLLRGYDGEPLTVSTDDGGEEQAWVRIAGIHSDVYRKAEQAVNDKMLKRRSIELTTELIERNELDKLASCILEWNLRDGTTPIPLSKANAITVLQAAPWIRRDIEAAMRDPARFLG